MDREQVPLMNAQRYDIEPLARGVLSADWVSLSRAITCVESRRADDAALAAELLELVLPHTGQAQRIGITGVPGVGKSTFIEAFGLQLLQAEPDARLAVLAIDPSSKRSQGSIMADKTRMEQLACHPRAYIRPSPSGLMLGGMARSTDETALLCEAAGFDYIFIETVGVGQSEVDIQQVADLVVMLLLPAAGDEWQGLKRGIIEIADLVLINKADGSLRTAARVSEAQHRRTMQLIAPKLPGWLVPVLACSAVEVDSLQPVRVHIKRFFEHATACGQLQQHRRTRRTKQLEQQLCGQFMDRVHELPAYRTAHEALQQGAALPRRLAAELLKAYASALRNNTTTESASHA